MESSALNCLIDFIRELKPQQHVALIGGGGKTSLMYWLVKELKRRGVTAVATSTTKLVRIEQADYRFLKVSSVDECMDAVKLASRVNDIVTIVSNECIGEKLVGIKTEWISAIAERFPQVVLIIEADGSQGKSLKGHLLFDPVIPESVGLVIPVVGVDVIGRPLNDAYVHRPQRVCELTGAMPGSIVTDDLIVKLLTNPEGYLHNCPAQAHLLLMLNKADTPGDFLQARELAETIFSMYGTAKYNKVLIGSIKRKYMELISMESNKA